MYVGVMYALGAALLFGASTPLAKALGGTVAPVMLAGLLYLGSGLGLSLYFMLRRDAERARLGRADWPWLGGAILAGGVAGPVLLLVGLAHTPAASAALLLNLEGVLTAALAWWAFGEHYDRRIMLGMGAIVVAGMLISWEQLPQAGGAGGALAIVLACLCWAIDNNFTRKVAASDALQIAAIKGLVAGSVNLALALVLGLRLPGASVIGGAALIGFLGYGLSLVLFVLALRHLGSARTGAYFSAAPLAGAALSMLVLGERPGALFWVGAALMAYGLYLHLAERHGHEHEHEELEHSHAHVHDEHHQHTHGPEWDGQEPHVHVHRHVPLRHSHVHYPDIHHRHQH